MNNDLIRAKKLLEEKGYTCIFVKGDCIHKSFERGVKPLLNLLESKTDLSEFSVADKVIGKAAAFLYILLNVKTIYANVISESALKLLTDYGTDITYGCRVEYIRNRTNTGFCPMEQAVINTDSPSAALIQIKTTLESLNKNN